MDESLGPGPCHCSPPEGTITKEGMLHYKAGTSYLGKEHWKACFVALRWEPPPLRPGPGLEVGLSAHWGQRPRGTSPSSTSALGQTYTGIVELLCKASHLWGPGGPRMPQV